MPKTRPNKEAEAFGRRLVSLLADNGQPRRGAGAYLHRKYGVSVVTANAWLNGDHKPEAPLARQIATDHGSTFEELYWGDEPRNDASMAGDLTSVLGYAQSAGLGAAGLEAQEYAETHKLAFRKRSLRKQGLNAESCRVMYGQGDSMEPTIREGDAILFDTTDTVPRNRRIYVLALPGAKDAEYAVKRAKASRGKVMFVADNPDGDHDWGEPRPLPEGAKIVGRVRWIGRWEG